MGYRAWRTSSYSGNGQDCVEVAPAGPRVLLRDTKDHGSGPVIAFSATQWAAFLAEVAADAPSANGAAVAEPSASGVVLHGAAGVRLGFTLSEWAAFRSGVLDGEFAGLVPA
jgi:hypothetical protein